MKVIGSGAPDTLTIQFAACERAIVLDELRPQRSATVEHATRAQERVARTGTDGDLESSHAHLLTLANVLHQLEDQPPGAEVVVVRGPTGFLHDVIHGAVGEAIEQLPTLGADIQERGVTRRPTPEQQEAVKVAGAWVETLVGCHGLDWHGCP